MFVRTCAHALLFVHGCEQAITYVIVGMIALVPGLVCVSALCILL